jgi:hypothetical protein
LLCCEIREAPGQRYSGAVQKTSSFLKKRTKKLLLFGFLASKKRKGNDMSWHILGRTLPSQAPAQATILAGLRRLVAH